MAKQYKTSGKIAFIHAPKTVDNDLVENDHTPGFGSAARFVASAFAGIDLDNEALTGVYVGVIMGRHAGFLTAASALARRYPSSGPHLIYLPERVFEIEKFLADVISNNESSFPVLQQQKLLASFDSPTRAKWIEPFKGQFNGVQFPSRVLQIGLAVNTNKVKKGEITKWTDMANPKWKGQLAMLGINSSISISSMYVDLAKKYGDDFMKRLGALRPNFQSSSAPTVQLAAAGEAALSLPISVSVLPALEKAGAPIAVVDAGPITGAQITRSASPSASV